MRLQRLTGTHRTTEPHVIGTGEQKNVRSARILPLALPDQHAGRRGLTHRLQQDHTGDDRILGEMPPEEIPIGTESHDSDRRFGVVTDDLVKKQKRIAMRKKRQTRALLFAHDINLSFVWYIVPYSTTTM